MRAIDLYSGVGGWTLGLKMAGIQTAGSYEWWAPAADTHEANFPRSVVRRVDIRQLPLESLPKAIDLVVGSPPCTQFSFANRGGNGDIADGLRDVAKFLEVVEYLSPRYWVMENVPRVARILERELNIGGALSRFAELVKVITVVDTAEFGLPQRRRRMLAGDFPLDLLNSYKPALSRRTLGQVVIALRSKPVTDPIYGLSLDASVVTDNEAEPPLDDEELRMNREAKQFHPFYNVMRFPDPPDRPARTVTATCTRVSRESIIIEDRDDPATFRRLTLRERACLQGFPITFQFFGKSQTDRFAMAGNAIPPLLTYYVAQSALGVRPEGLTDPALAVYQHPLPSTLPSAIPQTGPRRSYPKNRRFRSAIPNLRFGSGMRFELANEPHGDSVRWSVNFFYGTSKRIASLPLTRTLLHQALSLGTLQGSCDRILDLLNQAKVHLGEHDASELQMSWTRRGDGLHPYAVADQLGDLSKVVHELLPEERHEIKEFVIAETAAGGKVGEYGVRKIIREAEWLFAGIVIGSWFNTGTSPGD